MPGWHPLVYVAIGVALTLAYLRWVAPRLESA